ncbi:SIR2 family protein [Snodgrassella sp. W8124]|uniref:SIR2 family NAD-dependent protein deacylase n=1 Tax=Snodgrassella sp. W8124 TaxID=2750993 RepID=UPI0018DD8F74|nr:SIR2 family protein [Snodgrassella sp. W8124]MBI0129037.1 SIR2 family protein [Snodgrassella sp. W8124]
MTERDITKIIDYPLIQKLAQALWQSEDDGHGVAIMVGAGFSRSAATTQDINKKMPIWANLAKKIAEELGEEEHTDALRLAQMYQDYFGKQTLNDLLKNEIDDEIWQPAELYQQLLTLPWTEVLTTNWDTLLERAVRDIHEPVYDVVNKQEDLACCHPPRIVKLHGTINLSNDLIFTQEDYRHYPQKYGIFVNFVRQVFVENELCLIGFSGDDPNFLQWIGWVRDNLQSNARRIYLVGALNLSSAKRKYLESLNVAPIDLFELVADIDNRDLKHKMAIELFLTQLSNLEVKKAWDWTPEHFNEIITLYPYNQIEIEKALPALRMDRESYPDWIICPYSLRLDIFHQLQNYICILLIPELENSIKNKLLYEMVWRYGIIFYYNISSNFQKMLLAICESDANSGLSLKQQLEIALYLLKCTRSTKKDSDQQEIIDKTTKILTEHREYWNEGLVELYYHQVLVARDELNYPLMEKLVDKIQGADPVWKLRKAFILSELARYRESAGLINEVYAELVRGYRNNRNSIFILSRLAWAHMMKSIVNLEEFKVKAYSQQNCNPYDIIDFLKKEISDCIEEQEEPILEASFNPGKIIDNSSTIKFISNMKIPPEILFDNITNIVGLPVRWTNYAIAKKIALDIANSIEKNYWKKFFLLIQIGDNKEFENVRKIFNRIAIAQLPDEEVDKFVKCCFEAVVYWQNKVIEEYSHNNSSSYSIERLSIFIEILARFQPRLSSEEARKYYRLALDLGKNDCYKSSILKKSITDLFNYSLQSIPINQHCELITDALQFPVQNNGLNPIIQYPGKRKAENKLNYAISELINNINSINESEINFEIVDRILPLINKKFLYEHEKKQLIRNLYGKNSDYQNLLDKNNIYPSFFINLPPEKNTEQVYSFIKDKVFTVPPSDDFRFLKTLLNTLAWQKKELIPNIRVVIEYFDYFTSWKYDKEQNIEDIVKMLDPEYMHAEEKVKFISRILYYLVQYFPEKSLNQDNFEKLKKFYTRNHFPCYLIRAFIPFVLNNSQWQKQIIDIIKKGLKSKDELIVADAANAILQWGDKLSNRKVIRPLIKKLINHVESVKLIGIVNLLPVINEMLNQNWLTDDDINILIENLPEIYHECNYINFIDGNNYEVSKISFIRARCVKLARDILQRSQQPLTELQNILEEAKNDALPEVRFAETDEFYEL